MTIPTFKISLVLHVDRDLNKIILFMVDEIVKFLVIDFYIGGRLVLIIFGMSWTHSNNIIHLLFLIQQLDILNYQP